MAAEQHLSGRALRDHEFHPKPHELSLAACPRGDRNAAASRMVVRPGDRRSLENAARWRSTYASPLIFWRGRTVRRPEAILYWTNEVPPARIAFGLALQQAALL